MNSIFFDLETSDKNPIGQIINYSFILVDDDYQILDECSGLIRLSRLQIPSPGAILANRVDVLELQERAKDNEKEALLKIYQFIARSLETTAGGEKLPIIGYNSSRFDIPYLRTSFIRNGINPYFNGRIITRDLLYLGRKLASTVDGFPRAPSEKNGSDPNRMSLSLENLCHQFKLLQGTQLHESRADVLLTIALAQVYQNSFGHDVRRYDPFEALKEQAKPQRGMVRWMVVPQYDMTIKERSMRVPMVLLDFDYRSSLWIDMQRYLEKPERSCISWFSHNGSNQFVIGEQEPLSPKEQENTQRALEKFKDVNLKNFFTPSTCDIEQDIYRLDFDAIAALEGAIWRGDADSIMKVSNRDARVVMMRHQISAFPDDQELPDQLKKRLVQYAKYRYGGGAQLVKTIAQNGIEKPVSETHHQTLASIMVEIEELKKVHQDLESRKLLESLDTYIRSSEIFRALQEEG